MSVFPKFISLPNGRSIYAERRTASPDPDRTILFIHGLGGTVDIFYPVYSQILSAFPRAALLSYNWPGEIGDSSITMSGFVADIAAILALEAPAGPVTIIAHSAGTQLAMSFLGSESPLLSRVSNIVLIAGPLELPFSDEVVARQEHLASMITREGQQGVIDSLLPLLTGKTTMESRPLAAGLVRAAAMSVPKESYAAAVLAFANGTRAPAQYNFTKIPKHVKILVIGGEEDAMVSPEQLELCVNKIKGARHVTLRGVGHSPNVEAPNETAEVIAAFLKQ